MSIERINHYYNPYAVTPKERVASVLKHQEHIAEIRYRARNNQRILKENGLDIEV